MANEELAQPLPLPPDQTAIPPLPTTAEAPGLDQQQAQQAEAQPAAIPPPRPPGTSGLAQQAPTKGEIFRNMLGDFLYSAGKGLAAAGHGPEANARGAGAALTAIPERNVQQQMIGIQREQAQSMEKYRQAQADALTPSIAMTDPDGKTVMVPPAHVGQALAAQYRLAGMQGATAGRLAGTLNTNQTKENIADKLNVGRQTVAEINANLKANKEPTDPIYQITKQLYPEMDPKSKEFATAWEDLRMKEKTDPGVKRMMALAYTRAQLTPFETVEPGTNTPTTISNLQAVQTGAPKVPIGSQIKLGGQWALYNDAYGILNKTNELADKVNLDDKAVATRVAAGYAAIKDAAGTGLSREILGNMLARQPIFNELKPDERELVLTMAQGKAAATGLRGIMGQSGTNEWQQRLDSALMPGPQGASSKAGLKQQVQAMGGLLDRFAPGQVGAGLNAPGAATALKNKGKGAAAQEQALPPGVPKGYVLKMGPKGYGYYKP